MTTAKRLAAPFLGLLLALAGSSAQAVQSSVRVSSFTYDSATGLLLSETVEPDTATLAVTTSYTYDSYGNKATVTTVAGATAASPSACGPTGSVRTSQTAFSIGDAATPAQTVSQNPLCHAETTTYHLQYGTPVATTGPNGLSTSWAYDEFARKVAETRADGSQSLTTYQEGNAGCPVDTAYSIHSRTVNGATQLSPESYTCSDNLGRELRSAAQAMGDQSGGRWIYKDTHYDALGQVLEVSKPYFDTEGPQYWTQNFYDELGRTVSQLEPRSSGAVAYSYTSYEVSTSGDPQLTTTNPKGQHQTTVKNSQGWVIQITDEQGNLLTHGYDAYGNLTRTVDAAGNVTTVAYDTRGRKTGMIDPDMGAWSYSYNAFGEMTGQTDAKGQTTTLAYDKLGRLTQKSSPDLVTNWYYDKYQDGSACNKGLGKLCEMSAGNNTGRKYVYDSLGRPIQTVVTVATTQPAVSTHTFSTAYDAQGRVDTQTWPSGLITQTLYGPRGHAIELKNASTSQSYWRIDPNDPAAQDPYGHLLKETLGNNVIQSRYYQRETGWIYGAQAGNNAAVQNHAYDYDALGNIVSRYDGVRQMYETFQYDSLNRLTRADRNGNIVTAAYNPIGNLTSKSDVGDYSYGNGPGIRPHAVTSVAGMVNASYSYDANGNLTGGNNRSVTWTDWNMPGSITQGGNSVSFVYDGDHDRIQQVTPGGTITYLRGAGLTLEKTANSDGTTEYRHYLNAGGRLIAIYTTRTDANNNPTTASTSYFHPDHLNSIAIVSDEAGTVIARYDYDAWGKRSLASGNNVERRGFTGHEELEAVGLVHMNGRIYDPILGRFLSADPNIDGSDLQAFNRYTYVSNNPLTFTDPTGYFKLFGMKWSGFRDQVVKPVVAMVVAWYVGPAAFQAGFWGVGGAVATATGSGALGVVTGAIAGGALAGAVTTAANSFINTGDINMSGWGQAALSSALFFGAGEIGQAGSFGRTLAHAVAGCISSAASGGKCGQGAMSAGFAYGIGSNLPAQYDGYITRMIIGGTASVLGGGKFGNGAVTAAFGYLYNDRVHCLLMGDCSDQDLADKQAMKKLMETLREKSSDGCLNGKDFSICFGPGAIEAAPEKLARKIAIQIQKDLGPDARNVFHELDHLTDRTVQELKADAAQLYEEAGKAIPAWIDKLRR